jgi:hypothetical protein
MTVVAPRSAPGRGKPGIQLVGAVRALLSLFPSRVHALPKPTRGLFQSLGAFSVRVAHAEQHGAEGGGSDRFSVGEVRNVER